MPDVSTLKTRNNVALLNAIRGELGLNYQERVPMATQANLRDTIERLVNERPLLNEFVNTMMNLIGTVVVKNCVWSNPLGIFKTGMLQFGDTIEETYIDLIKASSYDDDRDPMEKTLFGTEYPATDTIFHRINRKDRYPLTINESQLRSAFYSTEGLADFVQKSMSALATSDQVDEFKIICNLIRMYAANGGFYGVKAPDVSALNSDSDEAKQLLRLIRTYVEKLKFVSRLYNPRSMSVAAKPEELVLLVTPEAKAAIDVNALAAAFNVDYANVQPRVITVPAEDIGIDGMQAILTTKDFFVIKDRILQMNYMENPAGLSTKHFLHHWGVLSVSLFAPAILFSTRASGGQVIINPGKVNSISNVEFYERQPDGTAKKVTHAQLGGMYQVTAEIDATDDSLKGVRYTVNGSSLGTYVTPHGVLHIGNNETIRELTVNVISTHIDPMEPMGEPKHAEGTISIFRLPASNEFGVDAKLQGITVLGVPVAEVVSDGTVNYTVKLPAGSVVKPKDVNVITKGNADVKVSVEGTTITIVVDDAVDEAKTFTVAMNIG